MENVPEKRMPRIGVGMLVKRQDGRFLFIQRKGAHGEGTWTCPGGHLDWGESFEQCGAREAMEETGVVVKNIRFVGVTNDYHSEDDKHYATIFLVGDHAGGEARVMEPEKIARVEWVFPDVLPQPIFLATVNLLRQGIDLAKL